MLLHRSLVKSDKNWNFGIEGGCSWDIYEKIDKEYTDQVGLYNGKIMSQRTKSNFSKPNITSRFGVNVCKDLKNNSTIHFNLTYNLSLVNWDNIYVESLSPINSNLGFYNQKVERNIFELSQNRLQLGLYITFGKIDFKKG